jgi:hypothetical protein
VGAVRQHHYVPLDFLSAEALAAEPLRRCAAYMKCEECQFRADVLSFKENAEYEAILNNLTYSPEERRWTASYPFIEKPWRPNGHQRASSSMHEEPGEKAQETKKIGRV